MSKWIVLLAIFCLLIIIEWMREIHSFKVTRYHIQSKKLKGLKKERKVVFLSDLHNYSYGENNEKLLRVIAAEKPDYILVSGDMLVGKPDTSTRVAEAFMRKLPAICPVYHANGNHEQRFKEFPGIYGDLYVQYKTSLEEAGVNMLENERVILEWDGIPVEICGLELPYKRYKKFEKHYLKKDSMDKLIGKTNESDYEILIAHNPTFVDTYLEWGADLVLSGHLHGGVVRLPGIGGMISPQFILFPKYSGEMKKVGDATVVVSKGIGIHTIKVRLFNPAEVVVMHISGTEE